MKFASNFQSHVADHETFQKKLFSKKSQFSKTMLYFDGIIGFLSRIGSTDWFGFSLLELHALHKKWNFTLRISSVNVTKSAGNCGFGHIYWRNL